MFGIRAPTVLPIFVSSWRQILPDYLPLNLETNNGEYNFFSNSDRPLNYLPMFDPRPYSCFIIGYFKDSGERYSDPRYTFCCETIQSGQVIFKRRWVIAGDLCLTCVTFCTNFFSCILRLNKNTSLYPFLLCFIARVICYDQLALI